MKPTQPSSFLAARGTRLVAAAAALALLAACADTQGIRPQAHLTDAAALGLPASQGQSLAPAADWWTALGDPQLDRLVAQALAGITPICAWRPRGQAHSAKAIAKSAYYRKGERLPLDLNRQRPRRTTSTPRRWAARCRTWARCS
ncbi:MAG: hypothetical protein M9943_16490 [Burkholderiaceae bacterium]|nr:hypothetical protein [Burkholderiaceae bacterium]